MMFACHKTSRAFRGFTLVEVLAVVTIIGIAGAIVVPQMLNSGTLTVQAGGRSVIADVLYAQNDAVAQAAVRRVHFDITNNRYQVTDGNDKLIGVTWLSGDPNAGNYTVDFNADRRFQGVKLDAADFGGTPVIEFDALGSPKSGGTVDVVFGPTRYRITVAPMTGRVTIAQQ